MRRVLPFVVALGVAIVMPMPAIGQSCSSPIGFSDVPASDPFCAPIDWLRNRGVTVGCGDGSAFCPDEVVLRRTMAAFMNRLAKALDPVVVRVEQAPGAVALASPQVLCTTPPQPIADFPRKFHLSGVFSARGAPDGDVIVTPVISINGGAFGNMNLTNANLSVRAGEWHATPILSVPQPGPVWQLQVGTTYTFGLLVQRASGSPDLTDSRCYLVLELRNRNGEGQPYDPL